MTNNVPTPCFLDRPDDIKIAYHTHPGKRPDVQDRPQPGVLFLGGFMSDMTGTKATHLEAHCTRREVAYTRFDYSGHGQSSGAFRDGTIGRWMGDAVAIIDEITTGPLILAGSSMGGWIMLLAALARPERVVGLLGIAAAPDFTEDLMWEKFTPAQKDMLTRNGAISEPSEYGDDPYVITNALIEDGRKRLLLRKPIGLHCPVRLVHGMGDPDVPWQTAPRLADALQSRNVGIELIKSGDHRLSEPDDLAVITGHLDDLIDLASR